MDLFQADKGAFFSEDRKCRYQLWRIWDHTKQFVMFVGLNPSTANEDNDDATIRRVMGFASRWGYGGVYMLNLFPKISTDPKQMEEVTREEAKGNKVHLHNVMRVCDKIICAWGSFPQVALASKNVFFYRNNTYALKLNKDGSPHHPLRLPNDVKLIRYSVNL